MKMLLTQPSVLAVVAAAVSLFGTGLFAEAQPDNDDGFLEIEDIPQTAVGLFVNTPFCVGHDDHPLIMWTIEPSDRVTVSTNPPDLLTWKMNWKEKMLSFAWNEEIASTATGGGVKIGFPKNQFSTVNIDSSSTVQILDGFEELKFFEVSGASVLTAEMSGNANGSGLDLYVSEDSKVTIFSDRGVSQGMISDASDVTIKAPSLNLVKVIEGSQITASSCDKIDYDESSSCNSDPPNVNVAIIKEPAFKAGTVSCDASGNGVKDVVSDMVENYSGATRSTDSYGIGIVAAVAASVAMM